MDTRVYTMTHKTFRFPDGVDQEIYIPLHVGRALGEDLGYQGDDKGDSVSDKNKNFCELTGFYWIWKNISCDLIGVAQYRRYLIGDEQNIPLTRQQIEDWLGHYDILISIGTLVEEQSVWENYQKWHHIHDLILCRNVIAEHQPGYVAAFDAAVGCRLFSGGNLLMAPKPIFDAYCEWLFDILFEVEKRTDVSSYDNYQQRIYGFLSERLIRVFLLANAYKVKEVRVGGV